MIGNPLGQQHARFLDMGIAFEKSYGVGVPRTAPPASAVPSASPPLAGLNVMICQFKKNQLLKTCSIEL